MAEALTEIARRPPLGEIAAELTAGIAPGVLDIRLLPPRARFTLRVAPALLRAGGEVAGFALDMAINRCTDGGAEDGAASGSRRMAAVGTRGGGWPHCRRRGSRTCRPAFFPRRYRP